MYNQSIFLHDVEKAGASNKIAMQQHNGNIKMLYLNSVITATTIVSYMSVIEITDATEPASVTEFAEPLEALEFYNKINVYK